MKALHALCQGDIKPYLALPSPSASTCPHGEIFSSTGTATTAHQRNAAGGTRSGGQQPHTEPSGPEMFSTPDRASRIFSTMDRSPRCTASCRSAGELQPAAAHSGPAPPGSVWADGGGDGRIYQRRLGIWRTDYGGQSNTQSLKPAETHRGTIPTGYCH